MEGYLTYCYCDQDSEKFEREWVKSEGKLWQKTDPNFQEGTYSECHQRLREKIQTGDYLFFRTNWRSVPYIIGYFLIGNKEKQDEFEGPQLIAKDRLCIDFNLHLNKELVEMINPEARNLYKNVRSWAEGVNFALGFRQYKKLNEEKTKNLLKLIHRNAWA